MSDKFEPLASKQLPSSSIIKSRIDRSKSPNLQKTEPKLNVHRQIKL